MCEELGCEVVKGSDDRLLSQSIYAQLRPLSLYFLLNFSQKPPHDESAPKMSTTMSPIRGDRVEYRCRRPDITNRNHLFFHFLLSLRLYTL